MFKLRNKKTVRGLLIRTFFCVYFLVSKSVLAYVAHFVILRDVCMDSNPESCHSKQARYRTFSSAVRLYVVESFLWGFRR